MADIQNFTDDLANIQKLDDSPGLPYKELQAEFDKAGLTIQRWINEVLIPAVNGIKAITGETDKTLTKDGAPADAKQCGLLFGSYTQAITNLQRLFPLASNQIGDWQVTTDKLAPGSVTAEKLAPGAVTNPFPVGYVYISTSSVNPETMFGGTWREISGKFLLSQDASHAAGTTGGSEKHTITKAEMPAHTHNTMIARGAPLLGSETGYTNGFYFTQGGTARGTAGDTSSEGSGQAMSIMPPYLSVYMWERTA